MKLLMEALRRRKVVIIYGASLGTYSYLLLITSWQSNIPKGDVTRTTINSRPLGLNKIMIKREDGSSEGMRVA
jgi:hypothetical protein